jgi:hypothetical protein
MYFFCSLQFQCWTILFYYRQFWFYFHYLCNGLEELSLLDTCTLLHFGDVVALLETVFLQRQWRLTVMKMHNGKWYKWSVASQGWIMSFGNRPSYLTGKESAFYSEGYVLQRTSTTWRRKCWNPRRGLNADRLNRRSLLLRAEIWRVACVSIIEINL